MYNNPIGPGSAAAGLGLGTAGAFMFGLPMWVFALLALFTLIGAGWALLRILPAGLTERPRAFVAKRLGRAELAPARHSA
jgi:hypothetical protein